MPIKNFTKEDIIQIIKDILVEHFGYTYQDVADEETIITDIGTFDDLDIIEFIQNIEDIVGINLDLNYVSQLIFFVESPLSIVDLAQHIIEQF